MSPLGSGYGLFAGIGSRQSNIPALLEQPMSLAYDGSLIWLADMGHSVLQAINPLGTTPGVVVAIDLSSYGVSQIREVRYRSGIVYASCHDSNKIILVNTTTKSVVGIVSVSQRARCTVTDNSGNFFAGVGVIGDDPRLYKYSISSVLAAFPSDGAETAFYDYPFTAYNPQHIDNAFKFETLTFDGTYIWAGTGGTSNQYGGHNLTGNGASINWLGGPATRQANSDTLIITGLSGMTSAMINYYISLAGATSPPNFGGVAGTNQVWKIISVPNSTTVHCLSQSNPFQFATAPDANNGGITWRAPVRLGGMLARINPVDGTMINKIVDNGGTNGLGATFTASWNSYFAFGNIWSSGGNKRLYRWDTSSFATLDPLTNNPRTTSVIPPSGNVTLQGDLVSDGSTLWGTAVFNSYYNIVRFNPGGGFGSESLIATLQSGISEYCDGTAFDGDKIWVTARSGSLGGRILRLDRTLGAEAVDFTIVDGQT
jgi:hypothetical protein